MVVYEITQNLSSLNISPFYMSLLAIKCADFMEDGHIYVRNYKPLQIANLLTDKAATFDKAEIPRMLLDISTQIEMLWSLNYTLLPFDEQDVYKINNSYCVLSSEKVAKIDARTNYCSLIVPVRLGQYIAPEVCSCTKLPCYTFCEKFSALYSLGKLASDILEDNLEEGSYIKTIIANLTHDNPLRRIPVVF